MAIATLDTGSGTWGEGIVTIERDEPEAPAWTAEDVARYSEQELRLQVVEDERKDW